MVVSAAVRRRAGRSRGLPAGPRTHAPKPAAVPADPEATPSGGAEPLLGTVAVRRARVEIYMTVENLAPAFAVPRRARAGARGERA